MCQSTGWRLYIYLIYYAQCNTILYCELQWVMHSSSPLLLVQQGEQRASRDVLGDNGELAGVVQTRPHKMDDTGVVEATEDGDLSAEHVHVWLGAARVGSIATEEREQSVCSNRQRQNGNVYLCVCVIWTSTVLWPRFCFDMCLCRLSRRSLSDKQMWLSISIPGLEACLLNWKQISYEESYLIR